MPDFLTPETYRDSKQDKATTNARQRAERAFVSRIIDPRSDNVCKSKTNNLFKTVDKVE